MMILGFLCAKAVSGGKSKLDPQISSDRNFQLIISLEGIAAIRFGRIEHQEASECTSLFLNLFFLKTHPPPLSSRQRNGGCGGGGFFVVRGGGKTPPIVGAGGEGKKARKTG